MKDIIAECPSCGIKFPVCPDGKSPGRPRLKINIDQMIKQLQKSYSVEEAAKALGCSKMHIYRRMKGYVCGNISPSDWIRNR